MLPFLVGGTGMYLSSVLQNYQLPPKDFSEKEYNSLNILPVGELKKILPTTHKSQYEAGVGECVASEGLFWIIAGLFSGGGC